jgi:hypothetical protein
MVVQGNVTRRCHRTKAGLAMTGDGLTPFVVTGCARSGTAYLAAVFSRLGLSCGHEVVFGPRTRRFEGFGEQHGDSSWLAAPFLPELPEDTLIMHRVRHPLRVVRSLLGVRFFADRGPAFLAGDDLYTRVKWQVRHQLTRLGHVEPSSKGPRPHLVYRRFLHHYAPQVWAEASPSDRALRYWCDWNQMILRHAGRSGYRRHHVESIDDDAVAAMLADIGLTVTPFHVGLVTRVVSPELNSRRVADIDWDDLPGSPAKQDASTLAERLGYDPRAPDRRPAEA